MSSALIRPFGRLQVTDDAPQASRPHDLATAFVAYVANALSDTVPGPAGAAMPATDVISRAKPQDLLDPLRAAQAFVERVAAETATEPAARPPLPAKRFSNAPGAPVGARFDETQGPRLRAELGALGRTLRMGSFSDDQSRQTLADRYVSTAKTAVMALSQGGDQDAALDVIRGAREDLAQSPGAYQTLRAGLPNFAHAL